MVSRRKFVSSMAGAMLTATVAPGFVVGNSLSAGVGTPAAPYLPLEAWAAQLNTAFQVRLAGGRVVTVKLVEAAAVYLQETRLEQYILIFEGPPGDVLPEGSYAITNAGLGAYSLHLAHCEQDEGIYQSTVCRLR